ncbi:tRNA (adenosine(37)-N6)-threonylcarbamoyltransferase complex transferase subunit TsaD [Candidatus Saccharibacteria bacterium]|nr:tRNA (adenosine(37)-N6)-threonylcarbamoyltransferase complex transferase subunit TsaD [Candidatus Saccharibacteria bacterium]
MNILAIETSCDETSVAVVEDGSKLHSLVVNSQIDIHKAFGGVVPEVAARSHIEVILPAVQQALDEAKMGWDDIDAIAVTQGPGLLGSLLIGVLTARTLAWSKQKPLYAVHHILGHIYANWITDGPEYKTPYPTTQPEFPVLALIVSGGHTQLMFGTNHTEWRVIGRTTDDAVGEAFDKVAKVLGLPYPGGPSVAQAADNGNPDAYALPTPKVSEEYGFSFSGLKTALLRAVQAECGVGHDFPSFELAGRLSDAQVADFAASFQKTAINYLVSKTRLAFENLSPKTVIIGGGVAASLPLREVLSHEIPIEIEYAPQILCTDNAAMIGARAYYQSKHQAPDDPFTLETQPSWPL